MKYHLLTPADLSIRFLLVVSWDECASADIPSVKLSQDQLGLLRRLRI
jgi:hypothetical protein